MFFHSFKDNISLKSYFQKRETLLSDTVSFQLISSLVSWGRMWLHCVRCPFCVTTGPLILEVIIYPHAQPSLEIHLLATKVFYVFWRVSWTLAIWSSLIGIKSRLKSKLAENSKIYEKAAFWLCELFRDSILPLSPYILRECGKRLLQCVKSGGERCFCPVHSSEWTVKPL